MSQSVVDVDGNAQEIDDQGMPVIHSQEDESTATEQKAAPSAPDTKTETVTEKVSTKPGIDYEKSYKELERTYTRDRQELLRLQKENESYSPYKEKLSSWEKADQLLQQDPVADQYVRARIQGMSHQDAQNFAEQTSANPHLKTLVQKVQGMEDFVQKQQKQQYDAQVLAQTTQHLDTQEKVASELYKEYFGKEMASSDKAEIYNWMVKKNVFDGEAAANAVFAKKYAEAAVQKALQDQKTKGTKVVQQTSTMNSASAKAPQGAMDFRQAYYEALKELRGN